MNPQRGPSIKVFSPEHGKGTNNMPTTEPNTTNVQSYITVIGDSAIVGNYSPQPLDPASYNYGFSGTKLMDFFKGQSLQLSNRVKRLWPMGKVEVVISPYRCC